MKNNGQQTNRAHIYDKLLGYMRQFLEKFDSQSLSDAIQHAQEQAAELDNHTREELSEVSDFLQRDLQDAGDFMQRTGGDLKRWLLFDWALIEDRLWDSFSRVADRTQLDMKAFQFRLQRGRAYQAGEMIGLGTLQCDNCGKLLHFHQTSEIPACTKCKHTTFSRVSAAAPKNKSQG